MKKMILLMVLIITLIILTNKEEVMVVNNELDSNEMETILIYIPGLNTNNFSNYFDGSIEIIGIYPKVNMLYKEKIGNMYYQFNKNNIKQDITTFTKHYKSVLEKNKFNNDLILINYNGISIESVKVYISGDNLENFMRKCNGCKYEKLHNMKF